MPAEAPVTSASGESVMSLNVAQVAAPKHFGGASDGLREAGKHAGLRPVGRMEIRPAGLKARPTQNQGLARGKFRSPSLQCWTMPVTCPPASFTKSTTVPSIVKLVSD